MHIHHLNCGCMCPIGGALFDGFSRGLVANLICHCLLVETNQGLVLIDTGFGQRDIQAPSSRLSPFFIYFKVSGMRSNAGSSIPLEANLGSALKQYAI
ncbi:hypothetical protein WKK05_15475 [Nostoc sp. UHCC 0302]|uniref:hypothetical protein n=1 Tax=Nostoc sp. UHCC 0302 TaxID=3134896 RepID=UPI00311C9053